MAYASIKSAEPNPRSGSMPSPAGERRHSPRLIRWTKSVAYVGVVAMLQACPIRLSRFFLASFLAIAAFFATLTLAPMPPSSQAAERDLLQPGDIAASGFAGAKLQVQGVPPGVDPVTKTV